MNAFEYANPKTLDEAVALLGANAGDAECLAGGSDLVNAMKDGVASPKRVVNLKNIADLRAIQSDDKGLRIGATATLADILNNEAVKQAYPSLTHAISQIKSPQVRNVATLGGNLCQRPRCWYYRLGYGILGQQEGKSLVMEGDNRFHAIFGGGPAYFVHPSSTAPVLISLDAVATLRGPNGASRDVPLAEFYRIPQQNGERETVVQPNEILTCVTIPPKGLKNGHYAIKQRECVDWPLVEAAVACTFEGDTARNVKVVLGHVAPMPWVAAKAAQALEGQPINEETAARAGEAAADGATPLSKNGYKVQLVKTAVKRAALAAAGKPVEA
ncbi:MAG: xanthine dehydrogenase family protein subunit M [FCB group bacterium]|jgi:xanthine dehydrogenase YagS FAD-binding subunit|nr:xanthine dehydrogenase family protein subunit M [FCB group bacterium]